MLETDFVNTEDLSSYFMFTQALEGKTDEKIFPKWAKLKQSLNFRQSYNSWLETPRLPRLLRLPRLPRLLRLRDSRSPGILDFQTLRLPESM